MWNKFWSSRFNNGYAIEIVAKYKKIKGEIFFKTIGCSKTIERPCLYGTSSGALHSIMATLLKLL
jgi:hypothetical protein